MVSNSRPVWLTVIAPLVVVSGVSALASSAHGQSLIVPDATLGNEPSQVVNASEINGLPSELVTGGAQRGPNLFHSFLEFNIAKGRQVYFANPAGIDNIFSRITGSNPSEIFGTLGVDGSANLFLLNPNGLTFGPNAQLDIEGSFLASTAEAITFEEGDEFSAVAPQTAPLLTVSVPLGLQHGASSTGATIANEGNLSVGQDLTLSADQLNLQGQLWAGGDLTLLGTDTLQIRDTSDRPFIAASRGNLLVHGNEQVDIFALNHPDSALLAGGNLVLRSANPVGGDAHYWSGGSFRVEQMDERLGSITSPNDPIIRSLGDVSFDLYRGTSLHILAGGAINIGTAIITGPATGDVGINFLQEAIQLSNGTEIVVDGSARPVLDLRAGVLPEAIGVPGITGQNPSNDLFVEIVEDRLGILVSPPDTAVPATSADIRVGDIFVNAPNGLILITNQYFPNPRIAGGTIAITEEGIASNRIVAPGFGGDGGGIFLDSRADILALDGIISTSGFGDLGDIILISNGVLNLDGNGGILSIVNAGRQGVGGKIFIKASSLIATNGAQIGTGSSGFGDAGHIIVELSGEAYFDGASPNDGLPGGVFSKIEPGAEGASGNIVIMASSLNVANGAIIDVSNSGEGDAGSITTPILE